jgi:hypothetical protein
MIILPAGRFITGKTHFINVQFGKLLAASCVVIFDTGVELAGARVLVRLFVSEVQTPTK